jgi:phosphoribosylformylglycinamidine cyclo-ligase
MMTTYRDAGVDIDAQDRALAQVKKMVRNTYTSDVLSDQGAFGGLFRPPIKGFKEPVLVASADGVGTKLKVAFSANRHHGRSSFSTTSRPASSNLMWSPT